jgi:hypothetical protein
MYPRTATGMSSRLLYLCAASACKAMSTPVLRSLIRPAAPREKWGAAEHIHAAVQLLSSTSWHRLGPGDMPLEAKRCRHGAVAIPELPIPGLVAVSPRQ